MAGDSPKKPRRQARYQGRHDAPRHRRAEDLIRAGALETDLVDVKIGAVSDIWFGSSSWCASTCDNSGLFQIEVQLLIVSC
jgi:hypothetical protein